MSKFLSKHLRHDPEALGLTLQEGGWVEVQALLLGAQKVGFRITLEELVEVVRSNDKQRFAFDESGDRIRANQGHSADVDLQLTQQVPPAILYHGTATRFLDSIFEQGLTRGSRHHVHLSATTEVAVKVGSRHGKPVVLVVNAEAMHNDGLMFYLSANQVWLTEHVPSQYLRRLEI